MDYEKLININMHRFTETLKIMNTLDMAVFQNQNIEFKGRWIQYKCCQKTK